MQDLPRDPEEDERREGKVPGQNRSVSRIEKSREEIRRLLGPVDPEAGLANLRGEVSIPGDCVGVSLEYTLAIAHRSTDCWESVTNFSLLALGANLSPLLFVLFFFHPVGCVYCVLCVRKEM